MTEHRRSLIIRAQYNDLDALTERANRDQRIFAADTMARTLHR